MASSTYAIADPGLVLSHFWPQRSTALVRDAADQHGSALDAAIRSGDYFITLATTLESIADSLAGADDAAAGALGALIKELEYAQGNYRVIPKNPRQGYQGEDRP